MESAGSLLGSNAALQISRNTYQPADDLLPGLIPKYHDEFLDLMVSNHSDPEMGRTHAKGHLGIFI